MLCIFCQLECKTILRPLWEKELKACRFVLLVDKLLGGDKPKEKGEKE